MPPLLQARPPKDSDEARRLRKLATSRHSPADWIQRASIVTRSWDGAQVSQIATELGCRPKTVYKWLHRFNAAGLNGLVDQPRSGRPRRLTARERDQLIALVRGDLPGEPVCGPGGTLSCDPPDQPARWTLDTLAEAARKRNIQASRSQIRRILLAEGVNWRRPRPATINTTPTRSSFQDRANHRFPRPSNRAGQAAPRPDDGQAPSKPGASCWTSHL